MLPQALRTVLRRLRPDWPVFATAALTVLVTTVQLAAVPIYTEAAAVGAMRRLLADAPAGDATLDLSVATSSQAYDVAAAVVDEALRDAMDPTAADVSRRLRSASFSFGAGPTDLIVMQAVEGVERHATIMDGAWPAAGTTELVPAALEVSVAEELGVAVGDLVRLTGRRDGARITAEIVGRYAIDDRANRFWVGDPLLLSGVVDGRQFRTWGPLLVSEAAMRSAPTGRLRAEWHVQPHLDQLTVAGLDELGRSLDRLDGQVNRALDATTAGAAGTISDAEVRTRLPALLSETARSLTITRSGVFAVVLQLGALSGLALLISGSLLVETRRRETELMRARGAGPVHMVLPAIVEACLLVAPAVLAGPWLAAILVRALGTVGPLAGLDLDVSIGPAVFTTVGLVAAATIGVLTWPAIRSSRTAEVNPLSHRRRQPRRVIVSRVGVDLALLGVMVLAFWQLSVLGSRRAAWIGDRLAVDPVLVVTPALALLAGAVTSLRLFPLLARAGERRVKTSRTPAAALAAWQFARRPAGQARPGFLLVMAFGIGVFTATYGATWNASQADQAAHQIGADLRVQPNRRTGDSLADLQLVSAHEHLDGVVASMPVARAVGPLPGSDRNGRLLAIDAGRAPAVVAMRDDLAPDFPSLMERLVAARPNPPGIELAGATDRLLLELDVEEATVEDGGGEVLPQAFHGRLALTLRDGNDLVHRIELGEIGHGNHRLAIDLTTTLGDGTTVGAADPVSIIDIVVRAPVPAPPSRDVELDFRLFTSGSSTGAVPVPIGNAEWLASSALTSGLRSRQTVTVGRGLSADGLVVALETGATARPSIATFTVRPGPAPTPAPVPAVVSRRWLESTRRQVGDSLVLPTLVPGATVEIAGVLEGFPTVNPAVDDVVLVDLPTIQYLYHASGRPVPAVDEHWLDLAPRTSDSSVSGALLAAPFESVTVAGLESRTDRLRSDPAALATIAAYTVGYGAAALFAVVVFAVTAAMGLQDRRAEIALLRALGLAPRELAVWQAAEHAILVVTSVVLGVTIGLVLAAVALPLLAVGQTGEPVVPTVRTVYPWSTLATVHLVPLTALALVVVVLVTRLRRLRVATLLRMGDG